MADPVQTAADCAVTHATLIADLVSALEPACGVTIAINVAYLGLRRFRHLEDISDAANKEKSIFDDGRKEKQTKFDSLPGNLKQTEHYKCLVALCNFDKNYDHEGNDGTLDKGIWPWFYRNVYRNKIDRAIAILCTALSMLALLSGVALKISTWALMEWAFSGSMIVVWFYALILSGILPVALGFFGIKVVDDRRKQAKNCREQIELMAKAGAGNAALPEGIPPNNPTAG